MRFHLGAVPQSADFVPDASWSALREPGPWVMQAFAVPLGVVVCAAVLACWFLLTPLRDLPFDSPLALLAVAVGIIPVHELIHLLAHPGAGTSARSILGVWPSRLLFYAHYEGELSRNRLVAERKSVLGQPEADKLLTRRYRSPFVVPEKVWRPANCTRRFG